jgi:hypothetical protein
MGRIFISYRRDDSRTISGRIYDRLESAFGRDNVFKDVVSIPAGADFRTHISNEVAKSDAQVVIIGPQWLKITGPETGQPRLANPDDFVRIEIESALQRGILVVPVLVNGAHMPSENDLKPYGLEQLAYRNAILVRDDPDFRGDMNRLVSSIKQSLRPISRLVYWLAGIAVVALVVLLMIIAALLSGGNGGDNKNLDEDSIAQTRVAAWTATANVRLTTTQVFGDAAATQNAQVTAESWTDTPTQTATTTDAPISTPSYISSSATAEITAPTNYSQVEYQSTVTGTYDPSQLQNDTLWLFVKSQDKKRFYPQATDRCGPNRRTAVDTNPANGTWSAEIFIGAPGDSGNLFEIHLLRADRDENIMILEWFDEWCKDDDFSGVRGTEGLSHLGPTITIWRK